MKEIPSTCSTTSSSTLNTPRVERAISLQTPRWEDSKHFLILNTLLQAFQTENNRGERRKKYSLQEEFVKKTKKESSNPFRKFLKSKSMKAQSLDGDLDFEDLSMFGSLSIIECSCGHNSCPNCNLTYM